MRGLTCTLRNELLKREIFYSLDGGEGAALSRGGAYTTQHRPHSSLRLSTPGPEAIRPDPKLLNLPLHLGVPPSQKEVLGLTL